MKVIKRPSAFAAVSELRNRMDEILAQLKETPVTLERRNKQVAVLEDPKRFAAMQEALEEAGDIISAFEARRRQKTARAGDYYSLEEVKKKFS